MLNIVEFIPKGKENAISMEELAIRTSTDTRNVRQLIYNARCNGEVICSTCESYSGGYYIPRNAAEAIPYYRQQLARINSATMALDSVMKFIGGENVG